MFKFNRLNASQTQVERKMAPHFAPLGRRKSLILVSCTLHYPASSVLLFFFPLLCFHYCFTLNPFIQLPFILCIRNKCACQKTSVWVLVPPFLLLNPSLQHCLSPCSIESPTFLITVLLPSSLPPLITGLPASSLSDLCLSSQFSLPCPSFLLHGHPSSTIPSTTPLSLHLLPCLEAVFS